MVSSTPPATESSGHVLVAMDKFKGSVTAEEASAALCRGLASAWGPGRRIDTVPVADGGEGTLDAAYAAGFSRHVVGVVGPTGVPGQAEVAISGNRAVVELASICGLGRMPTAAALDPLRASTFGVGMAVRACVALGATEIVLAVGGSASTDGGVGLLQALGGRFEDDDGTSLEGGGAALRCLRSIDLSDVRALVARTSFALALDVDNPLLGPEGAAEVYGPQKGADRAQVDVLEAGLRRLSEVAAASGWADHARTPGSGAAGGTAYGALTFLGAEPRVGTDVVLELIGFDTRLENAGLVITGEGSFDHQSLRGKAVMGVAAHARRRGIPVIVVCGRTTLQVAEVAASGIVAIYPLTTLEKDLRRSMDDAPQLLEIIGRRIAADHD